MGRLLNKLMIAVLCVVASKAAWAQDTSRVGPKPPVYAEYKGDTSYTRFNKNRGPVARAQINRLKNGALLVRLKTNQKAIDRLKAAGNMDLATQVERETQLTNKQIIKAYQANFKFCPVYFFFSQYSDSVKHQHLDGIFTDTTLLVNPNIVCHASFYLVAEQGYICNSTLGLVPKELAETAHEEGAATKEVSIVVKNRYFIQLHEPFPYYQKGYNMKKYADFVKNLDERFQKFYQESRGAVLAPELEVFVY
ncbi:MAG: hypothetical protein JST26_03805 [Bacteroidetes bacterium]|nr:hypothetical protein [Bacteroidota bacterium]